MKLNRVLLFALLGSVVFLETGCQWARWLRLLSLKKQLAQVERYVRVEDQSGLTLRFVKPVVYCDDLSLLIADETLRTTNKDRVTWVWTYEKQFADGTNAGPAATDLSISMGFHDLKFDEMSFPEPFLALMPKPLIIGLLRSVGQAEIDIRHGSVRMKWVGPSPGQKVELPTKTQVTTLLGPPYWITQSNQARTYLYKYYQKLPKPAPPAERLAWAKFTFANDAEEISSCEGVIGNVGWKMVRVPNQPEPHVTFSLVDLNVEPVAIQLPPRLTDGFVGVYKAPGGTTLNLGRDADAFVVSWEKEKSGGWCIALPETTNAFFGLPNGLPRGTFLRDNNGAVTGIVAQLQGPGTVFAKVAPQLPAAPSMAAIDPKIYADCAGKYKASWGETVTLTRSGDGLYWKNQGIRSRVPIYPSSETNFFFKAVDSPLTFVRNSQGEVTKFVLSYCGHQAEAVKIGAPEDQHRPSKKPNSS